MNTLKLLLLLIAIILTLSSYTLEAKKNQPKKNASAKNSPKKIDPILKEFNDLEKNEVFGLIQQKLMKNITIFCIIVLDNGDLKSRAIAQIKTWIPRCNKYIYASSVRNKNYHSVKTYHTDGPVTTYPKMRNILHYVYQKYGNNFDWYLKISCKSFVVMENLRMFLMSKTENMNRDEYYGFHQKSSERELKVSGMINGGSGVVFSKHVLKKLVTKGFTNRSICKKAGPGFESIEIAKCFNKLNIKPVDSRDRKGRILFLPINVQELASPYKGKFYNKLKTLAFTPFGSTMKALADFPITFSDLDVDDMYGLEYLFYHASVAGVESRMFRNSNGTNSDAQAQKLYDVVKNFAKYNYMTKSDF
uniref:Glycoprotein-N-acetylgalactosamine 3-beta-galactosyltransferase 1 n=1 Tax=Rhabditophanes sp. KR3021 TaxID=114890 RepID=A0AC35TWE5_9BILA